MPTVAEIMDMLRAKGALEKTAAAQTETAPQTESGLDKLAEELYYGGRLWGHAAVSEIIAKLAEEAASAHGQAPPSQGNEKNDASKFKSLAAKLENFHGGQAPGTVPSVPGSNPNVTAETVAPKQDKSPNPPEKTG